MKVLSVTVLASILAVAAARDTYFEHPEAIARLAKRQQNLATFTGALGGIKATPITCSGDAQRQFEVKGDTFVNFAAAAQRSCDQQQNACSDAANAGGQSFSVSDCQTQQQQCNAQQTASAGTCSATSGSAASGSSDSGSAATGSNSTAAASGSADSSTSTCGAAKRARDVNGVVKV